MDIIVLICASIVVLCAIFGIALPVVRGAPFFPTGKDVIQTMIVLAEIKPGQRVADIGSGDGRIVIEFARRGVEAHGYEINPFLVLLSKIKIKRAGLHGKAVIHWRNFWWTDFSSFEVIVIFGIKEIMKSMENKLERELKKGSMVISYIYAFPHWHETRKKDGLYVYQIKR